MLFFLHSVRGKSLSLNLQLEKCSMDFQVLKYRHGLAYIAIRAGSVILIKVRQHSIFTALSDL